MKVLITGATGLLGSHILETGLALGENLVALSRTVSKKSFLAQAPTTIEHRALDLLSDSRTLRTALKDIEVVIHAAGFASSQPQDDEQMKQINVVATQNLFRAAQEVDVKSWVQISSISTLSGATAQTITETNLNSPRQTIYAQTKLEAEQWLEKNRKSMKLTILHPTYMLGQWDAKPSSGVLLYLLRMKMVPHYIDEIKNFVAARDVAKGVWQCLKSESGEHFILGGHNLRISEFLEICLKELNSEYKPAAISLKDVEALPEKEKQWIREFCTPSNVSSQKAQEAFGYIASASPEMFVKEAVEYLGLRRKSKG